MLALWRGTAGSGQHVHRQNVIATTGSGCTGSVTATTSELSESELWDLIATVRQSSNAKERASCAAVALFFVSVQSSPKQTHAAIAQVAK